MRCQVVHSTGGQCRLEEGHFPETKHSLMGVHHCHARGCTVETKPEMLMCLRHWRMVPKAIQRRVWSAYRPGQCDDMRISAAWLRAADDAIKAVATKETP